MSEMCPFRETCEGPNDFERALAQYACLLKSVEERKGDLDELVQELDRRRCVVVNALSKLRDSCDRSGPEATMRLVTTMLRARSVGL